MCRRAHTREHTHSHRRYKTASDPRIRDKEHLLLAEKAVSKHYLSTDYSTPMFTADAWVHMLPEATMAWIIGESPKS